MQAGALLEEAGWVVKDFKRVHEETGEPFTLEFVVSLGDHERMLLPYVDNLKRLGIYTLGASDLSGYDQQIKFQKGVIGMLLGAAETLVSTNTFHVDDYSTIVADALEPAIEGKRKYKREEFPKDCEKAFDMGARFIRDAAT